MDKFRVLIVETVIILGFVLIAGCITAVVLKPETGVGIVIMVTALAGVATSTILQLRASRANAQKLDDVKGVADKAVQQTNGINTTLLAALDALVKHATGTVKLSTGEIEVVRDVLSDSKLAIDKNKGIK